MKTFWLIVVIYLGLCAVSVIFASSIKFFVDYYGGFTFETNQLLNPIVRIDIENGNSDTTYIYTIERNK